jgi:6-phosphogluconate dehydrogenase
MQRLIQVSDIGIIGSGVMGSNLGLNIADKSGSDRQ